MNITPAVAARQIVAARVERATQYAGDRLAYSTRTGDAPRVWVETTPMGMDDHEPHCFVCGRHTDHFAEHDDMVEAGTARYAQDANGEFNGDVLPIPWY